MSESGDSQSSDTDLLYNEMMKEVFLNITNCKLCQLLDCSGIEGDVSNYSILLNCITNHPSDVKLSNLNKNFSKIFLIEKYILKFFLDPELLSVFDALKGKYENQKKRHDLALISEKYYQNNISTLSCEQDIESLTFKCYKLNSTSCDTVVKEFLLYIFYLRKECIRFYKIYSNVEHSVFSNRLAILLSYNEDCEFKVEYEHLKIKSFINPEMIDRDISRLVFLENDDYETWKKGISFHYDWNDKVRLWMKNRCDSSCLLDKSMIEECIKHKRYDDGWIIYKYGSKLIVHEYNKIIALCISAIRHTDKDSWADRLIEVIHFAMNKHDFYICRDLIQDIFYTLGGISEKQRSRIIKHFIKEIRVMENNEEIVTYIIKGINELCKKCVNTETCDICVEHANLIYKEWKKNNTGGFFFKTHSKYELEIYENMLDMCDTIDDCSGFKNVCKDLMDNEAKINRGIFKKLQTVHFRTCQDCKHGTCHTLKIQDNQQLLNDIFNGFKF